jgi:hypothetical protein
MDEGFEVTGRSIASIIGSGLRASDRCNHYIDRNAIAKPVIGLQPWAPSCRGDFSRAPNRVTPATA